MSYDLAPHHQPHRGSGKHLPMRVPHRREIALAQADLNFHPDASPYWDSDRGQESLYIARAHGLKARNTNRERCAKYAALSSEVFA